MSPTILSALGPTEQESVLRSIQEDMHRRLDWLADPKVRVVQLNGLVQEHREQAMRVAEIMLEEFFSTRSMVKAGVNAHDRCPYGIVTDLVIWVVMKELEASLRDHHIYAS